MSFTQYFDAMPEEELSKQLYKVASEFIKTDYCLITAKHQDQSSSMVGSGGGFGFYMRKPTMWCILRSDRYTLEMIEKEQKYTFSYFPESMKDKVFFMANSSGRDSNKMEETLLTKVYTPDHYLTFSESEIVIECNLTTLTTIEPEDLYGSDAKIFVEKEYQEKSHYRKIAFGEIKNIWQKKEAFPI